MAIRTRCHLRKIGPPRFGPEKRFPSETTMFTWSCVAFRKITLIGVDPRPVSADPWVAYARELGVRLHRERIEKGLSQERLAVAAGITSFTYGKLEKGESNPGTPANPTLRTLVALAEVMDVTLAELLPPEPGGIAPGR